MSRFPRSITVKKEDDFTKFYHQVVTKGDLIEYYNDIDGCYIMKPHCYGMWEILQSSLNQEFKRRGIHNAYSPLQINKANPEDEPPCSTETVPCPYFIKSIQSYRDLPMKSNQWYNAFRYEESYCPLLGSREFLSQEGRSAFATRGEAEIEVLDILGLYRSILEEHLAIPVTCGRKFAGEGVYSMTCQTHIPGLGKGIQVASSHLLGQNFSETLEIQFENKEGDQDYAWQTRYGITTQVLRVMAALHADDMGLVLPPKIAPTQVIVVPISSLEEQDLTLRWKGAQDIADRLTQVGIRAEADLRVHYDSDWKFRSHELRGIPLRIEYDYRNPDRCVLVIRFENFNNEKMILLLDALERTVPPMLDTIQQRMFMKAICEINSKVSKALTWDGLIKALQMGHRVYAPWCEQAACEASIKMRFDEVATPSNIQPLCIPVNQPNLPEGSVCFACGEKVNKWCIFGSCY